MLNLDFTSPQGHQTFPRGCNPLEFPGANFFQTTTADFPLFIPDFRPGIRRFHPLVVLLHHKDPFVVQLDHFPTKNTWWSLINNGVVLMIKNWTNLDHPVILAFGLSVFVSKTFRIPEPLCP